MMPHRRARLAAGLCFDCGKVPPTGGRQVCDSCASRQAERARAYYVRRRDRIKGARRSPPSLPRHCCGDTHGFERGDGSWLLACSMCQKVLRSTPECLDKARGLLAAHEAKCTRVKTNGYGFSGRTPVLGEEEV